MRENGKAEATGPKQRPDVEAATRVVDVSCKSVDEAYSAFQTSFAKLINGMVDAETEEKGCRSSEGYRCAEGIGKPRSAGCEHPTQNFCRVSTR